MFLTAKSYNKTWINSEGCLGGASAVILWEKWSLLG